MYHVLSIPMKLLSRVHSLCCTSFKNERIAVLRHSATLSQLDDDDDTGISKRSWLEGIPIDHKICSPYAYLSLPPYLLPITCTSR